MTMELKNIYTLNDVVASSGLPLFSHGGNGKAHRVCHSTHTLGWDERWHSMETRFVMSSHSSPTTWTCAVHFALLFALSVLKPLCGLAEFDHSSVQFGKGFSFYTVQTYQGKAYIRQAGPHQIPFS